MPPRLSFTIGKCWQTTGGSLVFQVSVFDGIKRAKGYLELCSERTNNLVRFSTEKPESLLPSGGVANLIRKHLAAGTISGLAIHDEDGSPPFLRLSLQGKDSGGNPSHIRCVVQTTPNPEINVIKEGLSLARLKPGAQYTAPKQAPANMIHINDVSLEGLQAWLSSLQESHDSSVNQHEVTELSPLKTLPDYQRQARDRITRRLKTLRKTFQQDERKVPSSSQIKELVEHANLLKSFLWMVRPESFELKLDSAQTGSEPVTIALNPDQTPGANLEAIFTKIRKLERSIKLGVPRLKGLSEQIILFEASLERLRQLELPQYKVNEILVDLGLERKNNALHHQQKSSTRSQAAKIGRTFRSSGGDPIIIGRNASESDQLVKSAKSHDWWLHIAGGGHGSHVIVPGNKKWQLLPPSLLREAGILALHFSDRSTSKEGDVYVSRRQNIKKRKGMAPGLWQIDRAETVVIRYEAAELADLFAREEREGLQRQQGLHHGF